MYPTVIADCHDYPIQLLTFLTSFFWPIFFFLTLLKCINRIEGTRDIILRIYPKEEGEKSKILPSGAEITGNLKNNKLQGYGVMTWVNGSTLSLVCALIEYIYIYT